MSPMPRRPDNPRPTVSFRLPVELIDALDQAADARMLGRQKLVELLLLDGMARLAPVEVSLPAGLVCFNCQLPIADHCDAHAIPCCPGRCDAPITPGVDR